MGWFERLMFGVVFPFVFCSIGGFFARQGYLHFKTKKEKKLRCLSQTEGKIVSIHSMRMQRRQAYFPTYEYGVNGEEISVEIHFGTTVCQYQRGDQVKIWYDPNDPKSSYIDGYKEDTVSSVGCLILRSIAV